MDFYLFIGGMEGCKFVVYFYLHYSLMRIWTAITFIVF